jgi:hypothetical protein
VDNAINQNNNCVLCASNSVPNSNRNTCVCKTGYVFINSECKIPVKCPITATLNPNTNKCECPTNSSLIANECVCNDQNKVLSNGKCICNDNTITQSGNCVICAINSSPNLLKNKCDCNQGYYLSNNTCILIPTCPSGSPFNSTTNSCNCPKSSTFVNG